MTRSPIILLAALAALPLPAQTTPTQQPSQKLTVVIDAARGGSEYGDRIDGHTYEKQVTLDLANRLRSLLLARDFNVVLTRDNDTLVTNEQRAAVANGNKPVACLLLHATRAGTGLHLWTSSLTAMPVGSTAVLWDQAQAPFVQRSQRLASEFAAAFSRSKIAVSSGHTWIRPLDNMECPAVALEVGPEDSDTFAGDRSYQTHIAEAIASQLLFWRGHTDIVESVLNPPPPPAAPKPATAATTPDSATPARTRTASAPPADTTTAPHVHRTTPSTDAGAATATPRPTPRPPSSTTPSPATPPTGTPPQ